MLQSNSSSHQVYQRSLAVCDLSNAVAQYFSDEKDLFNLKKTSGLRNIIAHSIVNDASLIPLTIKKMGTSTSYHLQRRNLAFVNTITKNILSYCNGLEHDGVREREYLGLLRKEVKSFRKYFKQWRRSFKG